MLWETLWAEYDQQIVAFGLSLLTLLIAAISQARVRLRWGTSHGFVHSVQTQPQEGQESNCQYICTESHIIANWGNKTAHKVDVTLNFPPLSCEVWPQRYYTKLVNPENKLIIRFDYLNPMSSVTLNVINVGLEGPQILSVTSEESNGEFVHFIPVRRFSSPVALSIVLLLFLGIVTASYLLIRIIGAIAALG